MGTQLGQVPLHVSGLILHGAFCYQVKQSLSDYHGSFMLIRGSAGSFKCKIRWLHISLDLHNHAHNEVASVWVFLGGAWGWRPAISNIYLLSICVQIIGIFCCKTAEKIKKIKKKRFSGPLAVTFGTNEVVRENAEKRNFRIVRDTRRSQKH